MKEPGDNNRQRIRRGLSSSAVMTALVVGMAAAALLIGMVVFITIYHHSMIQNIKTYSEQVTGQVAAVVGDYIDDVSDSMQLIRETSLLPEKERDEKLNALAELRPEIIAITEYDLETGEMLNAWTGKRRLKEDISVNLSYPEQIPKEGELKISEPHVESFFVNEYPWVVSVSQLKPEPDGTESRET